MIHAHADQEIGVPMRGWQWLTKIVITQQCLDRCANVPGQKIAGRMRGDDRALQRAWPDQMALRSVFYRVGRIVVPSSTAPQQMATEALTMTTKNRGHANAGDMVPQLL